MIPFHTQHPVSQPVRVDPADLAWQARRFGALAIAEIQRCLVATYAHRTAEEAARFSEQDLVCAIAVARCAWRYASQLPPCAMIGRPGCEGLGVRHIGAAWRCVPCARVPLGEARWVA